MQLKTNRMEHGSARPTQLMQRRWRRRNSVAPTTAMRAQAAQQMGGGDGQKTEEAVQMFEKIGEG